MRVSATLKGSVDSLGRRTVYIRVSDGFQRTFKATNIRVAKSDWAAGKVKSSHPKAGLLNSMIRKMIIEKESALLSGVSEPGDHDFYLYVNDCLNQWDNTKKKSSFIRHKTEINKLQKYRKQLYFSDINLKWLNEYRAYCYSLGNAPNTVWSSFKFLRTILNKAYRERIIKENPFDLFPFPKFQEVEKVFLTESEIIRMDKFCKKGGELSFIGNWFLIGCYTGLRYSDMNAFDRSRIRAGRMILYQKKTGGPVSIPFNDRLKDLFERVEYKKLTHANQYSNMIIKQIAEICGIEQHISFHCARHTFATLCLTKGIRIEAVSKLMGHKNIKDTAVYAKLINPVIDKEYEKL